MAWNENGKNSGALGKNRALLWMILPVALLAYNLITNMVAKKFWSYFDVPLYAILNMLIAILFAYYLTQSKNDRRKKMELVEKLINNTISITEIPTMYTIANETDLKTVRIYQRRIDNRLTLLRKYEDDFCYSEALGHARSNFELYWGTISNHVEDIPHLIAASVDLHNYLVVVADSLERITVAIYE